MQLGELGLEMQGGHRLISFQVETQVLNGADATADAIAGFAQVLFAAVDGRPAPATSGTPPRRAAHRTRALGDRQGRACRGRRWDRAGRDGPGQGSASRRRRQGATSAARTAAPKAVVATKPPAAATTSRRSASKGT